MPRLTIADLLAEWDAEATLEESIEHIEETRRDSAPLAPETQHLLAGTEATGLRGRAKLAADMRRRAYTIVKSVDIASRA
jgi:hypothetical protein